MEFKWSEAKRAANLKSHGLDFVDVVTLGLLAGIPVSIVHTESDHEIRVISFRNATRREAQIYSHAIQD